LVRYIGGSGKKMAGAIGGRFFGRSARTAALLVSRAIAARIRDGLLWLSVLFVATAMLGAWPQPTAAQTQAWEVFKKSCAPIATPDAASLGGCTPLLQITAGVPFLYVVTLINNDPGNLQVEVADQFPQGFVPVSMGCAGQGCPPSLPGPIGSATVDLPGGQSVTYLYFTGYMTASAAAQPVANVVTVTPQTSGSTPKTAQSDITVTADAPLPTDIVITKTADVASVTLSQSQPSAVVNFTITVTNSGGEDVFLGGLLKLIDQLTLAPSAGLTYAYSATNWACSATGSAMCPQLPGNSSGTFGPSGGQPLAAIGYGTGNPGLLPAGDSYQITYQVEITIDPSSYCIPKNSSEGVVNHTYLTFANGSGVVSDAVASNNTASVPVAIAQNAITQECTNPPGSPPPGGAGDKVQISPAGAVAWGKSATYQLTVLNTSDKDTLEKIVVRDIMRMLPGMPLFKAQAVKIYCVPPSNGPISCYNPVLQGWKNFTTFNVGVELASIQITELPPGKSIDVFVEIEFEAGVCDSYAGNGLNQVANSGIMEYHQIHDDKAYKYISPVGSVKTEIEKLPKCKLRTEKTGPDKIRFGEKVEYLVTYANDGPYTVEVGSLYDAMALASNRYATGLNADYEFSCTVTQGTVKGAPESSNGVKQTIVRYAVKPQQGVRLIENLPSSDPVVFEPGSVLECKIFIGFQQPSPGNPYCQGAGDPEVVNSALMETSYYFNTSLDAPDAYAETHADLPLCYSVAVAKNINPSIATPGQTVTVTLVVQNNGDDPISGVDLVDLLPAGFTPLAAPPPQCNPACSPPATVSGQSVNGKLGPIGGHKSGTITFTAKAPGTAPQIVFNSLAGTYTPPPAFDWYNKAPNPMTAKAPLAVYEKVPLEIFKEVINQVGSPHPTGPFTMKVSCTLSNPLTGQVIWGPSVQTIVINLASGAPKASVVVPDIFENSVCTIVETGVPQSSPYGFKSPPIYTPGPNLNQNAQIKVVRNGSNTATVSNCYGTVNPATVADKPGECPPEPPPGKPEIAKTCETCTALPDGTYDCSCKITMKWTGAPPPAGQLHVTDKFEGTGKLTDITPPPNQPWQCVPQSLPQSLPGGFECSISAGAVTDPFEAVFAVTMNVDQSQDGQVNCAYLAEDNGNQTTDLAKSCQTIELPRPDLSVVKTGPQTCAKGEDCVFEIKITNNGAPFDEDVVLLDWLQGDAKKTSLWSLVSISPSVCGSSTPPTTFGCLVHLTLGTGQSVTYTVTLRADWPPNADNTTHIENCAGAVLPVPGVSPGVLYSLEDLAAIYGKSPPVVLSKHCVQIDWEPAPVPLSVTKTCKAAYDIPGAPSVPNTCQITVTSSGSSVPATIQVVDTLQDGDPDYDPPSTITSISGQGWTCPQQAIPSESPATCTLPGSALAANGGSSVIDMQVFSADAGALQELQNCVEVSGLDASGNVVAGPSNVCASFEPPVGTLEITKSGPQSCTVGQACTFNIIVRAVNGPFSGTVLLSDSQFKNLDVAGATPNAASPNWQITGVSPPICANQMTTRDFYCAIAVNLSAWGSKVYQVTAIPPANAGTSYLNCAYLAALSGNMPAAGTLYTHQSALPGQLTYLDSSCVNGGLSTLAPLRQRCDPATAKPVGGNCRCTVQGMVPVSKTACGCPKGTELSGGRCRKPPPPLPKCDGATAVPKGGQCACRYPRMNKVSASACACRGGFEFKPGRGCVRPVPDCREGMRYVPKRNRCEPVCSKGTEYNVRRNVCVKAVVTPKCDRRTAVPRGEACVCRYPNMEPSSKTACACPRGTRFAPGRGCVRRIVCEFPAIPNPATGECITIRRDRPRKEKTCEDEGIPVPCP
jgi:uncharacterized repeat protein (TIGR01451 family)